MEQSTRSADHPSRGRATVSLHLSIFYRWSSRSGNWAVLVQLLAERQSRIRPLGRPGAWLTRSAALPSTAARRIPSREESFPPVWKDGNAPAARGRRRFVVTAQ